MASFTTNNARRIRPRICHALGLLFFLHLARAVTLYGTESGYDNGGDDPVCFRSSLELDQPLSITETDGGLPTLDEVLTRAPTFTDLNAVLFETGGNVELQPSCPNGTAMAIEPLDELEGEPKKLFKEVDYTFRVTLDVFLPELEIDVPRFNRTAIHVRFLLCDALGGFCNPLQDTREMDESVRPVDTDAWAAEEDEFEEVNRWNYRQGDPLWGMTQGPVVVSRWVQWNLRPKSKVDIDSYTTTVDITLRLPETTRNGDYVFVGHTVMQFPVVNATLEDGFSEVVVERFDISAVIPDSIVEVADPPTVLIVSNAMKYVVGFASGIFGALALFSFCYILYHRNHAVMRLAQAPFLATIAGSCLVSIAFCFTYLPTKDIYCVMRGPMEYIPLTLAGAILVGRLWRVYMTLSVAIHLGRRFPVDNSTAKRPVGSFLRRMLLSCLRCMASGPSVCRRKSRGQRSVPALRQSVSAGETWSLIGCLVFPQFFLQIFGAVYYRRELAFEFDEDANTGRVVCEQEGRWTILAGTVFAAVVYLLAVIMAVISRDLPSAFNETSQILQASAISLAIAVITISLETIASSPTTAPDVSVFLRLIFAIGISTTVLVELVLPKVRRVWSGETVIMSTLLAPLPSKHSTGSSSNGASGGTNGISGLQNPLTNSCPAAVDTRQRVKLKTGEPLPHDLEEDIFACQIVLRQITERCNEGRPLKAESWREMKRGISTLQSELDHIDLDYSSEDKSSEVDEGRDQ